MDTAQLKIKFFTNEEDESLQVSETPLYVPVSLKRYGLSEVVNHLLGTNEGSPIPFDFLIDGQLLRTSIQDYLTANGLSSEAFLNVEYTRAVLPPSYLSSFNNEDWVSSVDAINPMSASVSPANPLSDAKILAGAYDGIVRTYNMSGAVEKQYVGHSAAVKAVKWISPTRVVTGGNDRQVRLWKIGAETAPIDDDDEAEEGKTLAILEGHTAPVSSLAVETSSNRILSGSYDNTVGFWSTIYKEMNAIKAAEYDSATLSTASKKRRKMATQDASIRRRSPLAVLEGHASQVEGVIFDASDKSVGYSVSQDHTIKTWDLYTARCVDTKQTGYSLLSVLQLPAHSLLATGSSARHINLSDPRSQDATSKKLVGHTNFVVSLAACPDNSHMFSSASHDGTVKVWDVRGDKPMYTITREGAKAGDKVKLFGVAWDASIGIISGGSDKKLQINKGTDIAK
ncbi:ribosome biogenesis protein Ytm1p [Diutina catenulata]